MLLTVTWKSDLDFCLWLNDLRLAADWAFSMKSRPMDRQLTPTVSPETQSLVLDKLQETLHLVTMLTFSPPCLQWTRGNALPTGVKSDKSVAAPTCLKIYRNFFLFHTYVRSTLVLRCVRDPRKEMILNSRIKLAVKRVLWIVCVCWLAYRGMSLQSRRHANSGQESEVSQLNLKIKSLPF